ncbi:MAG: UDP-N-acetylglucosamine--N-acetylmuramyl-(pentapeptide) pyrophosphoryl-undecaprenol N-acetylglucosamine transferase [Ruminococcaceae bacterium]|nr:UDP-N-acetylglucosamine--N-acetylmuramyl-(pentapeptide) pyrophosphoryl-undecaprenol N-acetylglucosamine transferase [Oscillospiraceae bacterium]
MKVLLSGGGTGGHVNPALAIGAVIEKHDKNADIHYAGTPCGIENKLVTKYPMHHVEIQGLRRSLSLSNLKTAYLTVTSFGKAKKLLRELKPDLVVGTGGYVCWPVVRAAASLGIPTALHESNAVPGLAAKMLCKKVDCIFVNFPDTAALLQGCKEVLHVGTPLREEFSQEVTEKPVLPKGCDQYILCFGGSLGAKRLNSEVLHLMKEYGTAHPNVCIELATGSRAYAEVKAEFDRLGLDRYPSLVLSEYIYDMPKRMMSCDLIICRSGAMTLSEVAAAGKASILIPSPNVTNDQQTKNARVLSDKGAAVLLAESAIGENTLIECVADLMENERARKEMEEKVKVFAKRDAGELIWEKLTLLTSKK